MLTFSSAENLTALLLIHVHIWPLKTGLSPANLPEKVIMWQNLSSLHNPEKIWSNNLIKICLCVYSLLFSLKKGKIQMVSRNVLKKPRSSRSMKLCEAFHRTFWYTENGLRISDKGSKCRNQESQPRRSKAHSFSYVTFPDGFSAWGGQEQKRLFYNSLLDHSSDWYVSGIHLTVRCLKWLCSGCSWHFAFMLPYIYLFSTH